MDNLLLAFNISFIPRDHNQTTASLALATVYFKVPKKTQLRYPIEVICIPSIPDNIKHWREFHDDQEIKKLLELTGEFSTSLIDQDEDTEIYENASYFKNSIGNHDIIEFKGIFIPKGLVPLERLFSNNDALLNPNVQYFEDNVISCNIGTIAEPNLIKLSKALSDE